jgi:hypothetical protein
MKRNLASPSLNSLPRCTHTTPSGRRCRSSASSLESQFCRRHLPKDDPAAALVRDLQDFRSVSDVTVFLSRLLGVLSRDEISTRRAAVLSYVAISLMHALRSLQREHETVAGTTKFDPLPWTWRMPSRGFSGFEDIHDARAFYAQQYADDMRKEAKESLAKNGIKSRYYPYRFDALPPGDETEKTPGTDESPLQAYSRLRS